MFAANGRIIGDSAESYVTRSGAREGAELVKRLAPGARIEDKY
jgi:uncharacterized protein YegP (UPF0339 family)